MMRRVLFGVVILALSIVVLLAFVAPQPMLGPGRLSSAHAALATDCFACHQPLRGADPARCLHCHALADIGLRTTRGVPIAPPGIRASFHQSLADRDCMHCHGEHLGAQPAAARKPFVHAMLRADLRDRCSSCHAPPRDAIHVDPLAPCGRCHTSAAWTPATFEHARFFALDPPHDARCATCHVNRDFRRYSCYGCHEHTPERVRRQHLEEGIRNVDDCAHCHRSGRDDDDD